MLLKDDGTAPRKLLSFSTKFSSSGREQNQGGISPVKKLTPKSNVFKLPANELPRLAKYHKSCFFFIDSRGNEDKFPMWGGMVPFRPMEEKVGHRK